ncbi:MAG: AAA family ATPase [bacterium]|nr:AAA family ATPase [bacterium]
MPEKILVRCKIKSETIRKELEEIISSVEGFYVQRADSSSEPCDLLIMEVEEDNQEEELKLINNLKSLGIVSEVFLTSKNPSTETLLQALRTGVREFFPQPFNREEIRRALWRFQERWIERKIQGEAGKATPKKGKLINLLGGKGGVGTTTVAVNLAVSLSGLGGGSQSIALVDLSLPFGDVALFLGIKHLFDWAEAIRNITRLDAAYLMNILFRHPSGVYVLPSPTRLPEESEATFESLEALFALMRTMFDFIIIDSGQSLGRIARETSRLSNMSIVVTILSLPCLINVKRILSAFRDLGFPPEKDVQLVANRVQRNSLVSIKEAEESIKKKFLASIPNNYSLVSSAINQGKPLLALDSGAEISRRFKELSALLSGNREEEEEGKTGLVSSKLPKWLTKVSGGVPIFSRTST